MTDGSQDTFPAWLERVAGPACNPIRLPDRARFEIGRDEECMVVLPHEGVSRRHCRLLRNSHSDWRLEDLGSTHGTFLDGVRIAPATPVHLPVGSRIGIGPLVFRFGLAGASDEPIAFTAQRSANADAYATRPTIFLRLRETDTGARELSWQEFRNRYARVIVGFARNAGLPAQEADDLLQDVLMAFFRVADRFEYDPAKGRFRGYLKRATLNMIRRRRKGSAGTLEFDVADEGAPAVDNLWEREWAQQVLVRSIDEARSRVDQKTFEAFELYAQRGVPAEIVAERLGIGVNSVHQAKSRVLKLARDAADRIRDEEG